MRNRLPPGGHRILALAQDERLAIEDDLRLLTRRLRNAGDVLAAPCGPSVED